MNKSSYKNCDAGHFFPATLEKCPFCTSDETATVSAGTESMGSEDRTEIMTGHSDDFSAGFGSGSPTETFAEVRGVNQTEDGNTVIVSSNPKGESGSNTLHASRKLVGWLFSYTINPYGVDFRLFEGQNTIGRDAKVSVRIIEDMALSSKHATILYRNASMYFKDEMSTNPSFVNDEEVMPGNTVKLADGDKIHLGDTILYVRFATI